MKKTIIIVSTITAFFVLGAVIIAWSVYTKGDVDAVEVSGIRYFTDDNFQEQVVDASKNLPILIDFYADWCFPCKLLEPTLQDLARDFRGKAVIGKIDTDKNMIARRFNLKQIPAVFVIRNGEIRDSFYGVPTKERLARALRESGS
jgi:thioredoxin 1